MSRPIKYCLLEIDPITGKSKRQKNRAVTKKYRKNKPFRRKYKGIQNVRDEIKRMWKRKERRKDVLKARKCVKNYEVKIPFKSNEYKEKEKSVTSKYSCQICCEEFLKDDITFIDCIAKGTEDITPRKKDFPKDKAICKQCKEKCFDNCPFCRSHELKPLKVRFRKKKLPFAERLKNKKIIMKRFLAVARQHENETLHAIERQRSALRRRVRQSTVNRRFNPNRISFRELEYGPQPQITYFRYNNFNPIALPIQARVRIPMDDGFMQLLDSIDNVLNMTSSNTERDLYRYQPVSTFTMRCQHCDHVNNNPMYSQRIHYNLIDTITTFTCSNCGTQQNL